VLELDQVSLPRAETHECLQSRTKCIEKITLNYIGLVRGKQPNPIQASNDAFTLGVVGKLDDFLDTGNERAMVTSTAIQSLGITTYLSSVLTAPIAVC
jgi:hypothetical protein